MFFMRTCNLHETFVTIKSHRCPYAKEHGTTECTPDLIDLNFVRLGLEFLRPFPRNCLTFIRRIEVEIVDLMNARSNDPTDQPLKRSRTWRIECGLNVSGGWFRETNM